MPHALVVRVHDFKSLSVRTVYEWIGARSKYLKEHAEFVDGFAVVAPAAGAAAGAAAGE